MRERPAWTRSMTGARLRNGDLLEGLGAIAALLLMLAIDVQVWLAILLAVMTYAGVRLLRPQPPAADDVPATIDAVEMPANDGTTVKAAVAAARFGLTPREREVLPLLAQRLTDREIAERLCISPHTAMRHVASILGKLDLDSRRDVAAFAAEHGLLPRPLPPADGAD